MTMLALEALDLQIAVDLMGDDPSRYGDRRDHVWIGDVCTRCCRTREYVIDHRLPCRNPPPMYSQHFPEAWFVVEAMQKRGFMLELSVFPARGLPLARCVFSPHGALPVMCAQELGAPRAICVAALEALARERS